MFHIGNYLLPSTSPTISSISSSDLDTESTGSFFHDGSTTLGTLMGLSFAAIPNRVPSHRENNGGSGGGGGGGDVGGVGGNIGGGGRTNKKGKKPSKKRVVMVATVTGARERRRRWWWNLCRDDGARPGSLGDFLDVERRFGDGAFYGATAELEGVMPPPPGNGRLLFVDGRVLPPPSTVEDRGPQPTSGALCRFPVLLTGICSGSDVG